MTESIPASLPLVATDGIAFPRLNNPYPPEVAPLVAHWNALQAKQPVGTDTLKALASDPSMAKMIVAAQKAVYACVDELAGALARSMPAPTPVSEVDAVQGMAGKPDIARMRERSCERLKQARERKAYAKEVVIAGIINYGNKDWRIDAPFRGWTAEQNPSLPLALLMLGPLPNPAKLPSASR